MIRINVSRSLRFAFLVSVALMLTSCDRPSSDVDYPELASLRSLGLAYLEEGRPSEAALEFALLADQASDEPLGPANLAVAELRRGAFDAALVAVTEARRRAPDDPEVLFIGAAVFAEVGRESDARNLWRRGLDEDSVHLPSLWALGTRDSSLTQPLLERLLGRQPANLPARLYLGESYLSAGMFDAAIGHVEYLRQLLPRGDDEAKTELEEVLRAARLADQQTAVRQFRTLHNLLRVDPMYGSGLRRLAAGQAEAGVPLERFRRLKPSRELAENAWRQIRFTVTDSMVGLGSPLLTDFDGDGDLDLIAEGASGRLVCLLNSAGAFGPAEDCIASGSAPLARPLHAADFDGDARTDVVIMGPDGLALLMSGDSLFADPIPVDLTAAAASVWSVQPIDADHDGDLDILVGGEGASRLYQQTLPGLFTDVGRDAGIADLSGVRDWSFGDLDDDGDVDLVTVASDSIRILWNLRQGQYELGAALAGISAPTSVILIDVDMDRDFDILATGTSGLSVSLNRGADKFDRFESRAAGQEWTDMAGLVPLDFDNDGRRDFFLVSHDGSNRAGIARGLGEGRFSDVPDALPSELLVGDAMVGDLDGDGDEDILIASSLGLQVLTNEGGNLNHHMSVQLLALADGSGKVNRLGLGSRLDVTAGDTLDLDRAWQRMSCASSGRMAFPRTCFDPRSMSVSLRFRS